MTSGSRGRSSGSHGRGSLVDGGFPLNFQGLFSHVYPDYSVVPCDVPGGSNKLIPRWMIPPVPPAEYPTTTTTHHPAEDWPDGFLSDRFVPNNNACTGRSLKSLSQCMTTSS
ncbi:uncharacterized protein DS421_20g696480 [Arachis hypogaea]|nr:uncharacterized protein DS421_20g696480 [Arachis hypogaea]